MSDANAIIEKLLRQQAAIASFGSFALREHDLNKILTEAARACANGLNVPYCKICRYREAENDLIVEAGYGWEAGVVGHVVSRADASSPQGRAFISGQPSICNDLEQDASFVLPSFYAEHGIRSTIDVLIKGGTRPYGVLEIDNNVLSNYEQHDIIFLTGFANVLAEAVSTSVRVAVLKGIVEQMEVLAEELQHRVRNNLQLVYAMLSKQLDDTEDSGGKRGLRAIARRVSALAQVYDHLLGNRMTRTTDFGGYVESLCLHLTDLHGEVSGMTLNCHCESMMLDLDVVTALGIVVTELVSNSYDHASPRPGASTTIDVHCGMTGAGRATLTIQDDGPGFNVIAENKRHGLGLVRRLVEQVNGSVRVVANHGVAWTINFPTIIDHQSIAVRSMPRQRGANIEAH